MHENQTHYQMTQFMKKRSYSSSYNNSSFPKDENINLLFRFSVMLKINPNTINIPMKQKYLLHLFLKFRLYKS